MNKKKEVVLQSEEAHTKVYGICENFCKVEVPTMDQAAAKIYPIGSIYISINNTDPSILFGGRWDRFANGRALVGVDENDNSFKTVKKTGGHKEMQSHKHSASSELAGEHFHDVEFNHSTGIGIYGYGNLILQNQTTQGKTSKQTSSAGGHIHNMNIMNAGNGDSGNLQPYITAYMWVRTE